MALVMAALPAAGGAGAESPEAWIARGEAAWERRAEGSRDGRAAAGPIGEAISAFERALEATPDSIDSRARLLRALYFQARFATDDDAARRALYARGRDLAEEGIALLASDRGGAPFDPRSPEEAAAALADRPESAALFFWAAGHWGLWAEMGGALAAARHGVAGRIRDYARTTILIDPRYESAGGHRILGRLHTEAPRVPLFTGWVDRAVAVTSLERAVALAPRDALNRLYLADALLRFQPRRRTDAIETLETLIAELSRPGLTLQDRQTLADARRLLADAGG